jgi:O-antigen/teichoic acid export membrane protein
MAAGLGWVTASSYLNRAVGFFTTLILARLLAPEDFGLITVASMMVEVMKIFRDMGFSQALIHRQTEIEEASDTAFRMVVSLNLALFALAAVASPLVARFFDDPSMTPILIIMAGNLVPIGIRSVPEALIRKATRFDKLVLPEVIPSLLSAGVGIALAMMGYGVWSLVIRTLLYSVLGAIMIWWFVDYRPQWRFNRRIAGELYHYGKFIVGGMLLTIALYNIDKLFIAKFDGIASLGIYTMAWAVASIPVTEFGHLLCRVAFPVFCQVNQDPAALRQIFLGSFRYNLLAVTPLGIGIMFFGSDLSRLFLDEKWAGIGPALTILAGAALLRAVAGLIHELLRATNQVRIAQRFTMARLVLLGAFGIPALQWGGLNALCQLVLVSNALVLVAELWVSARLVKCRVSELLSAALPPVLAGTLTIGATFMLYHRFANRDSLLVALAAVLCAVLAYVASILVTNKHILSDARALFRPARAATVPALPPDDQP